MIQKDVDELVDVSELIEVEDNRIHIGYLPSKIAQCGVITKGIYVGKYHSSAADVCQNCVRIFEGGRAS